MDKLCLNNPVKLALGIPAKLSRIMIILAKDFGSFVLLLIVGSWGLANWKSSPWSNFNSFLALFTGWGRNDRRFLSISGTAFRSEMLWRWMGGCMAGSFRSVMQVWMRLRCPGVATWLIRTGAKFLAKVRPNPRFFLELGHPRAKKGKIKNSSGTYKEGDYLDLESSLARTQLRTWSGRIPCHCWFAEVPVCPALIPIWCGFSVIILDDPRFASGTENPIQRQSHRRNLAPAIRRIRKTW